MLKKRSVKEEKVGEAGREKEGGKVPSLEQNNFREVRLNVPPTTSGGCRPTPGHH